METSLDTTSWPLYRMRVGRQPNIGEFQELLWSYTQAISRGLKCCLLVDASKTTRLELAHVKAIARFGDEQQDALATNVQALALVIPSAMVRGAMKAAFQLKKPPHPYSVVRSIEDAETYLQPYVQLCRSPKSPDQ